MKTFFIFSLLLTAAFSTCAAETYRNPVICADYSDPDIERDGADYWMVASSFGAFPGIPVLHSRNLVDWELKGHVYDRLPYGRYELPAHGEGAWAPSIRKFDDTWYVYFCTPSEGLFVATADRPDGEWTLRQMAEVAKWEDPCPFRDDDGRRYLVRSAHRGGPMILHRLSDDGLTLLDDGVTVYHDTIANPTLEGPKMMKRDGWYYILAPAGGVGEGWQTVLRSRNIYGPYESRRMLTPGGESGINGPHQGALIDTPDGAQWWFLHFSQRGVLGRVSCLEPARWTADGWPEAGDEQFHPVAAAEAPRTGEPVRHIKPATSDDFDHPTLGLQWQWQANPREGWYSLTDAPGHLRLFAAPCPSEGGNLWYAPNLMLQKFPAQRFEVTTLMYPHLTDSAATAGLVTMGNEYSYIALRGDSLRVVTGRGDRRFPVKLKTVATAPMEGDRVWLRSTYSGDNRVAYSYSFDGTHFERLGAPCVVAPGTWIGAKTGLFCITPSVVPSTSHADFDFFKVE